MHTHGGDAKTASNTPPVATHNAASVHADVRGAAGPMTPAQLLFLQRTAGNAAAVRALARERSAAGGRGARALQRVVTVGDDPVEELRQPGSRGLIYGMSPARLPTSKRLNQHDMLQAGTRYRTIDAYNLAAGVNSAIGAGGRAAALGIIRLREALDEHDPVAAWHTHFPEGTDPTTDADLGAWIAFLAKRWQYVGLYDLGVAAKVQAKHRFTKNLKSQAHAVSTTLTADAIGRWLDPDVTYAEAARDIDARFTPGEIQDIGKWIYSAFFRRTSKLGIDFVVERGDIIHLNLAADPDWVPGKTDSAMQERGLEEIQHRDPTQAYGRSITSSEYRHAQKVKLKAADKINFYSEIDAPPPVVAPVVAGPAPKKKRWYKPWTWFK
jgi:hypothetical protein